MVSTSPGKKKKVSSGSKQKNDSPVIVSSDSSKSSSPKSCTSRLQSSKIIRSYQSLLDSMEPTEEELQFRESKSKNTSAVERYSKSFKCTKCGKTFNLDSDELIQTHPCLGVLMCDDCCDYYENGEFSLDSEGEDKYCRWCGEGGTIFGCSKCICGFCLGCIKKHFGVKYLNTVKKDDDWECFFCNPKPLWEERYICSLAVQMSKDKANRTSSSEKSGSSIKGSENENESSKKSDPRVKNVTKSILQDICDSDTSSSFDMLIRKSPQDTKENTKRKLYTSSEDEESDKDSFKSKPKRFKSSNKKCSQTKKTEKAEKPEKPEKPERHEKPEETEKTEKLSKLLIPPEPSQEEGGEGLKYVVLQKLEKILKLSEYQLAFGVNWSSKISRKLAEQKDRTSLETLKDECGKIKWFFSVLSTYLVEFCNSVDSVEKLLQKDSEGKDDSNVSQPSADATGFTTVMQFLSFVTNQVKTFTEKGLSLTDVINAEVYDDDKIIGIRKTGKASPGSNESPRNESQASGGRGERNTEVRADEEESRDEDSFRLKIDQSSEPQEGDEDLTDMSSSGATPADSSPKKSSNKKKEILEILEILEHA